MRALRRGEPRELDLMAVTFLAPSVLYVVLMFVYPFLRGIYLSLRPGKEPVGLSLANYVAFFSDEWQYRFTNPPTLREHSMCIGRLKT